MWQCTVVDEGLHIVGHIDPFAKSVACGLSLRVFAADYSHLDADDLPFESAANNLERLVRQRVQWSVANRSYYQHKRRRGVESAFSDLELPIHDYVRPSQESPVVKSKPN